MTLPISIVITVYNRERYLSKAIESVLNQTRRDFELLIWDDGSTDHSVEIAYSYAEKDRRVRVLPGKHLGQGCALKAAFAATTGAYVGQVDSDDFLAPTALEETAAVLNRNTEVGLVYTDYIVVDEESRIKGEGRRCRIPYSKDRLLVDFMVFHFRLIRRAVYEQVGGIDESFESVEDYDLCLRLSEVGEIKHVKRPLYYYREHNNSLSHHKQIDQILLAKKAISHALERRGLSDRFEVKLQLAGKFFLQEKT